MRHADRRVDALPWPHPRGSRSRGVGADTDLSHMPIGDCAMADELRPVSGLEFGAFQPAHPKHGAWLKSVHRRQHDAPNVLWVADITYIPTWVGFIYLAVVLDVWSRRVVGWSIGETLHTEIILAALNMAVQQRRPVGVIHHFDNGTRPNMPASPSGSAAGPWACARRWGRLAAPTTTRWPRASSPVWSANCSTGAVSRPRPRCAWPYSRRSGVGATRVAATVRSATCRR